MNSERKTPTDEIKAGEILRESAIYRNFSLQREEVLRHKWFLSERAGHDVGFETALLDWMIHHRQDWLKQRAL